MAQQRKFINATKVLTDLNKYNKPYYLFDRSISLYEHNASLVILLVKSFIVDVFVSFLRNLGIIYNYIKRSLTYRYKLVDLLLSSNTRKNSNGLTKI